MRARPNPASQAERVIRMRGYIIGHREEDLRAHKVIPMKMDNIMPSRQSRADRRCVRWKDIPSRLKRKVDESNQDS